MNEELNDRLKSRITDVFDNYEDDSAHEGWLLLREKYPEKEKRRPVAWLWWASVAAGLLITLGIGLWLNNDSTVKNNLAQHTPLTHKKAVPAIIFHNDSVSTPPDKLATNSHTNSSPVNTNQQEGITTPSVQNKTKANVFAGLTNRYTTKNRAGAYRDKLNNNTAGNGKQQLPPSDKIDSAYSPVLASQNNLKQLGAKNTDSVTLANNSTNKPPVTAPVVSNQSIVKELKHPLFVKENPIEPKAARQADKAVKFGVYAATYFNYAKGSDNEFNVGAGFSSEIKLAGNLKLVTGVAISQNSLNYKSDYKSGIPEKANAFLAYSIGAPSKDVFNSRAAAVIGPSPSSSLLSTVSSPVLQNYQASLVGLDIPVNLKYQFSKSDTYIAAGISSGTYINETYQFIYNYPSPTINPDNQNTKTQTFFNTFDFARTVNVSFGMGYPLGKNRLIVEPFLKYPIDGLGSQDIKFGAGGINLKFNFQSAKK